MILLRQQSGLMGGGSYSLRVFDDGLVKYSGDERALIRRAEARLDRADLDQVRRLASQVTDSYTKLVGTCPAWLTVEATDASGTTRTMLHPRGGGEAGRIAKELHAVARTERWMAGDGYLGWLSAHQEDDGSFSSSAFQERCRGGGRPCAGTGQPGQDVAVTALAAIAFVSHGSGSTNPRLLAAQRWLGRRVSGILKTEPLDVRAMVGLALSAATERVVDPADLAKLQASIESEITSDGRVTGPVFRGEMFSGEPEMWCLLALSRMEGRTSARTARLEGLGQRICVGMPKDVEPEPAGHDEILAVLRGPRLSPPAYLYLANLATWSDLGFVRTAKIRSQPAAMVDAAGCEWGSFEPRGDWGAHYGRVGTTALVVIGAAVAQWSTPLAMFRVR